MSLKYGGRVFRSLEEQVRQNMSDISDLSEEITSIPSAGEAVDLEGETSGTLTTEQLSTLQASNLNYIILNENEIFELADDQLESGFMIYSHVGYNAGKTQIKILSITTTTKSFTVVAQEIGEEEKLYKHYIKFSRQTTGAPSSSYEIASLEKVIFSTSSAPFSRSYFTRAVISPEINSGWMMTQLMPINYCMATMWNEGYSSEEMVGYFPNSSGVMSKNSIPASQIYNFSDTVTEI